MSTTFCGTATDDGGDHSHTMHQPEIHGGQN